MGATLALVPDDHWEASIGACGSAPLPIHVIHNALVQREEARLIHDFAAGDRIRSRLRAHRVNVDDNARTWQADGGRSGTRPDAFSAKMFLGQAPRPPSAPQHTVAAVAGDDEKFVLSDDEAGGFKGGEDHGPQKPKSRKCGIGITFRLVVLFKIPIILKKCSLMPCG